MQPRLITLTTDFGLRDAYVASMKAAILQIAGNHARILDVTHEISPHDVMEAAFVLAPMLALMPSHSVNVVVVDPGVGSDRRGIAIRLGDQFVVGPDNGVLTLLAGSREPDEMVVLDKPAFWRCTEPSPTFHGRDIFGPAAAHLARGSRLVDIGTTVASLTPMHWALPIFDDNGVRGFVVHVDRFGNCVTNVPVNAEALADAKLANSKLYAGNTRIEGVKRTYADVAAGEPVALFGSSGFLEVAVNGGSAADLLGMEKGSPVSLLYSGELRPDSDRGTEFATQAHTSIG